MAKTFITSEELRDEDVALQGELDAVYSARGAANGFAPLNAQAQLPSIHVIYGTSAESACRGDDVRLARPLVSLNTTSRGTATATYAPIHQFTTGVLPAGNYLVEVWIYGTNATGINSAINSPGRYQVLVDGSIQGPANIRMPLTTHQRSNADARVINSCSHFMYPVSLTNATHTISLNTSTQAGTFTVTYSVIVLRSTQ